MTVGDPSPALGFALNSRVGTSPFFDATIEAGASHFSVYNHMLLPVAYGDPDEEYRRLTEAVAVWDVAGQRQIAVSGSDAHRLAQLLSARDISKMRVGQAKYVPMCDHTGRLLNDPLLLRTDDEDFWFSIADNDVLLWVRAVGYERELDVAVDELDVAPLAVQGPLAEDTVSAMLGDWVRSISFFSFAPYEFDGIPLLVGRSGWSKQGGFELYLLDPARGTDLWLSVMAAGSRYGIGPGAPNAVERLESGLFSLRSDAPDDADPFEVGLARWVELDSGVDFLGKAALVDKRNHGLRRQLVTVDLEDDSPPVLRPWPVTLAGQIVGSLRSTARSPRLQRTIGVAFVDVPANAPGTVLHADIGGLKIEATVGSPFGERPLP